MEIVLSHPTGNANVRAAAGALAKAQLLSSFHTSIAFFPGSLLYRLGAIAPLAEIRRRTYDPVLKPFTQTHPWREMGRVAASKSGWARFTRHEEGAFCIDAVYRQLDIQVAASLRKEVKQGARAVYAYDDGAIHSFREAKRLGLQCLYDLPTGYWRSARKLLEKERERWPEWAPTITGFRDSARKLQRKDQELRMADRIFVASRFTARTLEEFPGRLAPVQVIPYGFPPVAAGRVYHTFQRVRPLRILFIGKLSQQKGIADLFAAVQAIGKDIELTVVGRKACNDCMVLNAALAKHRWIPSLPHGRVLQLMREHDVLVFPSLFDGFGLVITEAMSQGTPVITTLCTAGPDLIEHGRDGWLIEAGCTRSLQAAIEKLLQYPDLIPEAGLRAMEKAGSRPWQVYELELTRAIWEHIKRFSS